MRIGVPTEIKSDEYRVALTPAGARELTARGHEVILQAGAGEGSAIADSDYVAQGARAPHVISRKQLGLLKEGAEVDGIVHYCVANMPSAVR